MPVLIISGAPPSRRRESGALVHHLVSNYYLQLDVYRKMTADAALLADANTAPDEIDRVIRNCLATKLPGYLELPADITHARCRKPGELLLAASSTSNKDTLAECIAEAAEIINKAKQPVILVGIEVLRFGLGKETLRLVETIDIPFATMVSSKSVLPELHPQFIGLYQGGWSKDLVRRQVEESDGLLSLGAWMTDIDTGLFSINLDNQRMISAGNGQVRIGNHYYHDIQLQDFILELSIAVKPRSYQLSHPAGAYHAKQPYVPISSRALTASRLYECLNYHLDDQMIVLAEPGDAFCAAPEFNIEEAENFIVQAYYSSIGYCTPAALGVALARPGKRPFILTGDGAFQMTAQEVSTLIREHCPGVIVLINNDGYLIERKLHEDGIYNDIQKWQYAKLPAVFGDESFIISIQVATEEELEKAMQTAASAKDKLVFIEACLPNRDCSAGLDRLGNVFRLSATTKREQ